MNRRNRNIIIGIFILIFAAASYFALQVAGKWNSPIGESLGLPSLTATIVQSTPVSIATKPGDPTATKIPSPTATPSPLCGGPAVMTLLAIGSDTRANNYLYGLADVVRVVRVDFVTPKITVVDIPRDIWVEIPEISSHYDITHGKVNQSYLYGNPGMGYYDGPGGGPGLLARTIDQNFGVRVDHYGAVNMQTFVKIVDAVGGIDVFLPEDVDGRPIDEKTEDMGYFYAGKQHFSGIKALKFARIRKKYNTFIRTSNQNIVLCALKDKMFSPSVLPRVPQLITSFQGNVQTDLSLEQIIQLACLLPKIKGENLIMTGLPEELLTASRQYDPMLKGNTFIFDADFEKIRSLMADFQSGTWPTPEPDSGPTCPEPVLP
jgi:LCP family protein required for cell wall assembly